MDETTKSIIDRIIVRYPKPQQIPGGHTSHLFFDSAQLTPNDLARMAAEAVGHLGEDDFDLALGLSYRGILFAAAVAGGRQVAILEQDGTITGPSLAGKKVVVVDDVIFTGKHVADAAARAKRAGAAAVVGYACIVDRTGGALAAAGCPVWSAYQAS